MDNVYGKSGSVLALSMITIFTISGVLGSEPGQLVKIGSCTCPEDIITYHCIVNAPGLGGFTIWRGTAFNCPAVQNRVLLRHNSYQSASGAFGQCGDAIVGRSLRVDPNFVYVSELKINITANPELIGRTVECVYNPSGDTIIPINSTTIINVEEPPPPPANVRLTGVSATNLDFTWTPAQTDCSTLRYVVTSDCGNCAISSNLEAEQPMASCSFLQPGTTDNVCTLSVQSLICRNLSSAMSVPVSVNLRVPGPPTIYSVVPMYLVEGNRGLQSAIVNFSEVESFAISNGVDGSAVYYKLEVSDSSSRAVCGVYNVTPSSCEEGACMVTLDDLTTCLSGTDTGTVTITVTASNWLGNGPLSSVVIDKLSQNVIVNFETPTRIVCTYVEHALNKSCDISYGSCDQSVEMYTTVQGRVNSLTTVNIDLVERIPPGYCYVINASSYNTSHTVQFHGTTNDQPQRSDPTGVIVGSVIVVLLTTFVLLVGVLVVVMYRRRIHATCFKRRRTIGSEESQDSLLKEGGQSVYAHIILTIEDELKQLVSMLESLSSHINIKNIKICQCEDEQNQPFKKTVYIQNEHDFSQEEIENIRSLSECDLLHDFSVYHQAQLEQIPEDKEHDPRRLWIITETLKHSPGALCSLLKTFQKIEECRHINITDIVHEEVDGQSHVRRVTIKFYPDLPRNWREKFDQHKVNCAYIELSEDSKNVRQNSNDKYASTIL